MKHPSFARLCPLAKGRIIGMRECVKPAPTYKNWSRRRMAVNLFWQELTKSSNILFNGSPFPLQSDVDVSWALPAQRFSRRLLCPELVRSTPHPFNCVLSLFFDPHVHGQTELQPHCSHTPQSRPTQHMRLFITSASFSHLPPKVAHTGRPGAPAHPTTTEQLQNNSQKLCQS